MGQDKVELHGRTYRVPGDPVVVVCIDGSEPDYHRSAVEAGRMPFLESLTHQGGEHICDCVIPAFTNPNNLSIATGAPPSVHGICGNTFFDREQGREVMMNDPRFLRADTIFSAFERVGVDVAVVTAKDKLRRLLGHGLEKSICFSAEKAGFAKAGENGIEEVLDFVGLPQPSIYSSDLSEFVMAAGVKILRTRRPKVMYLTLTDYIQHRYAPQAPEAIDFYAMLDSYFAQLDALGAVLVITADHGMRAKSTPEGVPQIVYLQTLLDDWVGRDASRVVLPIADPYTKHHGSLGSFALIYVLEHVHQRVADRLAETPGVTEVIAHDDACERFELPADRIGDLVVIADRDFALGTRAENHDLAELDGPLRSHGGYSEQSVPLFVNRPLGPLDGHRLRNLDAFWVGLNLVTSPRRLQTEFGDGGQETHGVF